MLQFVSRLISFSSEFSMSNRIDYRSLEPIVDLRKLKKNQEVIVSQHHRPPSERDPIEVILLIDGNCALTYNGTILRACENDGNRVYATGNIVTDAIPSLKAIEIAGEVKKAKARWN